MPASGTVTVTAISAANSSNSGSAMVTLSATDPLGTVSTSQIIPCPAVGVANATCYQLNVQCPEVADFSPYLKVNQPSGSSVGTVMFGTGTGGSNLYDNVFTFGTQAVQAVLAAGFTTVQVSFGEPFNHSTPNGWLTGPGGIRRLACRYATTAEWVYQHIHNANAGAPLCATGNSGGSAAIAYGVSHYGLDSIFSMVEPTSGPPMARLDNGCICNAGSVATACGQGQISLCYDAAAAMLIDQAYGSSSHLCTQAAGNPANEAQLLSDSVNGPGANFAYPKTDVHVVFGGRDTSSAVPQGTVWLQSVTQAGSAPIPLTPSCVADSPHTIPDVSDGASQISDDIKARCKLQ